MKSLIKLLLVVIVHFLFSLIFIITFRNSFDFLWRIIPLHLGILSVFMVVTLFFMGLVIRIEKFRNWKFAKYVFAFILASGTTSIVFLYLIDYMVNLMGAHNITYDVIFVYINQLDTISDILQMSENAIYVVLIIIVLCIFIIYITLSGVIFNGLKEIFLPECRYSVFRNIRRTIITLIILVSFFTTFTFFMVKKFNPTHWASWQGEPITNLIVYWSPFGNDPARMAVSEYDRFVRKSYPRNQEFDRKNIILIIIDSIRSDHMQIYGYHRSNTPYLSYLMEKGSLKKIKLALSTCPETACGILSTFASKNYSSLADYNFKIYELLKDLGYDVYFICAGDLTYYQRVKSYFGKDIDFYFDGNYSNKYPAEDDSVIFEGLKKVPDFSGTPTFFYFHMMSVHFMGIRYENYAKYQPSKIVSKDHWLFMRGVYDEEAIINRYDNGILQVDAFLKGIMLELKQKNYLSNSVIFILGDHGESLGERGRFGHDYQVYQTDISIPLLIIDEVDYDYGNMDFATQIDIAPTITERLGLKIPECWQGKSLLNSDIKSFSFHQTRWGPPYIYTVIYRTDSIMYKYIRWQQRNNPNVVKEKFYNLTLDPEEQNNLILNIDSELLALMKSKMEEGFNIQID